MASPDTPQFTRIPPHSEEAERGVLGCAILDAARVIDLGVERGVRAASFYFPAHQTIWETAEEMHQAGKAVDPLTLTNRLREKQVLEEIGGIEYLHNLAESTVITAHVEYYVDIVMQKSILRTVIQLSNEAVEKCYNPDLDPNVVLAETEAAVLNLDAGRKAGFQPWDGIITDQVNEINRLFDSRQDMTGVPTGFKDIDKVMRGMQGADMIVLAARPSMGKTSLALNIAENVAMGKGQPDGNPRGVAIFSLEMSSASLARRMICCRARVPMSAIGGFGVGNETHAKLLQAAQELKQAPIYIDDTAGIDVMDMRSRARRLKKKHDIAFIVVDYLQIAHCNKNSKDGWQREVAGISAESKAMAKELDVPVLILSQLSRAAETRDRLGIPKLSDLRDSGSIEQDADLVWLLRRPARYPDDPRSDDQLLSIVDIAKHRNGATGEVELNFFGEYTCFDNRVPEAAGHPI